METFMSRNHIARLAPAKPQALLRSHLNYTSLSKGYRLIGSKVIKDKALTPGQQTVHEPFYSSHLRIPPERSQHC
ncbi:hypothetical protein PBY51_017171 [Eleginops maclovinus]|uniref:Uncharacterized protein n=1 Tax=Eleginops maclovinus TaxID=56733 RepID=A0AAN7XL56_ELEMC|nr:hypothetical protein PBY51_017171 [Eleginops maclovinus]